MDESKRDVYSLEEIIGKTIRRVWVDNEEIILDFEGGLTLQIEADEAELRVYLGEAGE